LARTRPGEARLKLLNAIYQDLGPLDKGRCLAALEECRRARRIEMLTAGAVIRLPDGVLI
jgi:hypothetical protein